VVAYDAVGRGRPLLLLHGFPLSRRLWRPQLDGLPDAARLIAPDLRGHGQTPPTRGPYSMDQLAADAANLLDFGQVEQPVVVAGLSMGGYVALAFARQYPERVAGLILAATRAGADSPDGRANRDRLAAAARAQGSAPVVEAMLPKMLAPAAYEGRPQLVRFVREMMAGTSPDGLVGALLGMRDRPDSTPLLADLRCPVLILHGAQDQIIPPAEAEAMHTQIPGSRLQILPEAGHLLNLEQPLAFNAEVRTFLLAAGTR
jgi:pimeloyl-ACP methyl ester carboxylesterase